MSSASKVLENDGSTVLLHEVEFYNSFITKRCLHTIIHIAHMTATLKNVSLRISFHNCSMIKDESNKKIVFCDACTILLLGIKGSL